MITHNDANEVTDKKENILKTAAELFAHEGYNAVSTSKIAKLAGVSEGLIFRHFTNKKGLLLAIIKDAEQNLHEGLAKIIFETSPELTIKHTIELPFQLKEEDHAYWRLIYMLKWDIEYYNPEKMRPLIDKLTTSFKDLGYEQPGLEAKFLTQTLDALTIGILRDGMSNQMPLKDFLLKKYKL